MFSRIWKIFRSNRPTSRVYQAVLFLILIYILSYFFSSWLIISNSLLFLLFILALSDGLILNKVADPVLISRAPKYQRLSNGDENTIFLYITSQYAFSCHINVIDELPVQFQVRDFNIGSNYNPGEEKSFSYMVRPVERGEYHFGAIHAYVTTKLGLIERHLKSNEPFMTSCYPSFIRLRQFELMAIHNRLSDLGIKRIRRIGVSSEFEQIKEYVSGDDVRKMNWKATARSNKLMVNHYRDERSQHVYSVIDMGRVMKMPFEGLKLLDYAINASLVLSHVAWNKEDKPALINFAEQVKSFVKPDNRGDQLMRIQESLYNAQTNFMESNYENLYSYLRRNTTQRSLLLLFTNFETLSALKRQLKYLKGIASRHLLVVIFFENTELNHLLNKKPQSTFEMYEQIIAQKFDYEKRLIKRELQKVGILSVYTTPEKLTVNALNKYIEIKARGMI